MNKFHIVCTSFNNEKWTEACLSSILNQTYTNYQILFIDDCSIDNTYEIATEIAKDYDQLTVIKNKYRRRRAYNIMMFNDIIPKDNEDIITFVDGDDWLYDETILEKINNEYENNDYWMTYGQFVIWPLGNKTKTHGTKYSDDVINNNLFRQDIWRASHLRTFKWFLYKNINKNDIKDNNNNYYTMCEDLITSFACLEMSPKEKIGVIDYITYIYNGDIENRNKIKNQYINDNENEAWHKVEKDIRNKKSYTKKTKEELIWSQN